MKSYAEQKRKTRRRRRMGGDPPKIVVSNPAWNIPSPKPKTNPAAGTGLFPGGRKNGQRRGGGDAEQEALVNTIKRNGSVAEVQAAISRGADVNTGIRKETPPLSWAIHKNRLDLVKLLVENGADVNRQDLMGGLPLVDADRRPEILRYLIHRGAKYPPGWPVSRNYQAIVEKQGAIEVGVKKDLPSPLPSLIRGFLGARRKTRRRLIK